VPTMVILRPHPDRPGDDLAAVGAQTLLSAPTKS
jgi:hypothetical protein